MKKTLTAFVTLLCGICLSAQPQGWEWNEIDRGVQWGTATLPLFHSVQSISAARYPAAKLRTEVVNDPGKDVGGSTTTSGFGERYDALVAINGSYFNMKTLYPATYIRDDRKQEGCTDDSELFRVDGAFALKGHKGKVIPIADTLAYEKSFRRCREVMAAGPVLITGGEVLSGWPTGLSFYDKRHPRSVVGMDADGYIYYIVIDGRFPGQADGTTVAETAEVARLFGLVDAINLDGGGSSALWVKGVGVISHPYDNHQYDHAGERIVPNALIAR